jgi:hypothetical protein
MIQQILLRIRYGKEFNEILEKEAFKKVLDKSRTENNKQINLLKENHSREMEDLKYYHEIELQNRDQDNALIIERIEQRVRIKERELEKEREKLILLQDQARKTENTYVEYILEMKQLEYELKSLFGFIQPIVQLSAKFEKFFSNKESNKQKQIDDQFKKLGLEEK